MKKVIDVSANQGTINWSKVKGQVDGAIIRLGYRGYGKAGKFALDAKAMQNIKGCRENGIPYGIYFFPTSITFDEAVEEAEWIHAHIKDYKDELAFPIFLDSETAEAKHRSGRSDNLDKRTRTNLLNVIMRKLKELGYSYGVYASKSWFIENLIPQDFPSDCHLWVAQYASKCTYVADKDGWQYTSSGMVDGITRRVDMSQWYVDFNSNTTTKPQNPYTEPTRILYKRIPMQYGNDVKWLQYELIRHGCLAEKNAKGKSNIDGWLGNDTHNAILKFQKQANIAVDGKVGAITRRELKK